MLEVVGPSRQCQTGLRWSVRIFLSDVPWVSSGTPPIHASDQNARMWFLRMQLAANHTVWYVSWFRLSEFAVLSTKNCTWIDWGRNNGLLCEMGTKDQIQCSNVSVQYICAFVSCSRHFVAGFHFGPCWPSLHLQGGLLLYCKVERHSRERERIQTIKSTFGWELEPQPGVERHELALTLKRTFPFKNASSKYFLPPKHHSTTKNPFAPTAGVAFFLWIQFGHL